MTNKADLKNVALIVLAASLLTTACAQQVYEATYERMVANCPQEPYSAKVECDNRAARAAMAAAGHQPDSSLELAFARTVVIAEAVDNGEITRAQGDAERWQVINQFYQEKRNESAQSLARVQAPTTTNAQIQANISPAMQMPTFPTPSVPSYRSNGLKTTTYVTDSGLKYTHCRDNVCLAR